MDGSCVYLFYDVQVIRSVRMHLKDDDCSTHKLSGEDNTANDNDVDKVSTSSNKQGAVLSFNRWHGMRNILIKPCRPAITYVIENTIFKCLLFMLSFGTIPMDVIFGCLNTFYLNQHPFSVTTILIDCKFHEALHSITFFS